MSNETKIGILAIVAIALSLWGYKFIMGKNMLTSSLILNTEYAEVDQLAKSSPILFNGMQVGVVSDVYLEPTKLQSVIVEMDLRNDLPVPKNAVAELVSTGVMGGKAVSLSFSGPCQGADCAETGDFLKGVNKGLLASMLGSTDDVKSYVNVLTDGIGEAYDTLSNKIAQPGSPLNESYKDLDKILANLVVSTNQLNRLLTGSTVASLEGMMQNLNSTTAVLEANNEQISKILASTAAFTGNLETIDMEGTLKATEAAIAELKTTLQTTNKAMTDINQITSKINNSEGTLGKLIEDEELYNRLNSATKKAENLMTDIQEKPYRYLPLKSRNRVKKYDEKDEEAKEEGN